MAHKPNDPTRPAVDSIQGLVLAALEFQRLVWAGGGNLEEEKVGLAQSLDFVRPIGSGSSALLSLVTWGVPPNFTEPVLPLPENGITLPTWKANSLPGVSPMRNLAQWQKTEKEFKQC